MNKFAFVLPLTMSLMACFDKEERLEGQEAGDCSDMADNDMDGDFDCEDDGCANSPECDGDVEDTGAPAEDTGDTEDTQDTDDTEGTDDTEDTEDTEDTQDTGETEDTGEVQQDTDGDGLSDDEEIALGTSPNTADSDGDGISDGDEVNTFGTDPLDTDSDGDGLSDSDEINIHGTNPLSQDTDGDGYLDNDELNQFQTNPTDASSGGYTGGWPYQPNKDSYNAPTSPTGTSASIGALLLRDELMDQHGEMVDLYDFAGQGKYTAIAISATWSPVEQMLSDNLLTNTNGSWGSAIQRVNNGDVYFITLISQNMTGTQVGLTDLQDWYNTYPNTVIPILADTSNSDFANVYSNGAWPTIVLFDENMQFVTGPTSTDPWAALTFIDEL